MQGSAMRSCAPWQETPWCIRGWQSWPPVVGCNSLSNRDYYRAVPCVYQHPRARAEGLVWVVDKRCKGLPRATTLPSGSRLSFSASALASLWLAARPCSRQLRTRPRISPQGWPHYFQVAARCRSPPPQTRRMAPLRIALGYEYKTAAMFRPRRRWAR